LFASDAAATAAQREQQLSAQAKQLADAQVIPRSILAPCS
jgi:hypothetical protein